MDLIEEEGNESIAHKNLKHDLAAKHDLKTEYAIGPYRIDLARVENGKVLSFYEIIKTCMPPRRKIKAMLQLSTNIYFITLEGQVSRLTPRMTLEHSHWLWEW